MRRSGQTDFEKLWWLDAEVPTQRAAKMDAKLNKLIERLESVAKRLEAVEGKVGGTCVAAARYGAVQC